MTEKDIEAYYTRLMMEGKITQEEFNAKLEILQAGPTDDGTDAPEPAADPQPEPQPEDPPEKQPEAELSPNEFLLKRSARMRIRGIVLTVILAIAGFIGSIQMGKFFAKLDIFNDVKFAWMPFLIGLGVTILTAFLVYVVFEFFSLHLYAQAQLVKNTDDKQK